ncbi:ATP-binding protein [Methanobrevibacter sp.]|uniref:ATP-binding protein n=1 Tax=Methanobrevibacter sp. TaxID=66852 RepID=UPI00388E1829
MKYKIFLSSGRKEFENERLFIKQEIENDYILNRFFEIFAFEKTSASGVSPEKLYSDEVVNSDIYIGLIGSDYGSILESGISPTELEYDLFNKAHNDALIYIKNSNFRDDKTVQFINKIKNEHSYQRFDDRYELFKQIRRSLGDFLGKNLKNYKSFDSELLLDSSCDDVDMEALELFFNVLDYNPIEKIRDEKGLMKVLSTIKAGDYKNGEFRLNTSGALFFAKDISKFNISHEVKMVRFYDNDGIDTFEKTELNTSLLKILKEAESFFYKVTINISQINGFERVTTHEYPFEAIREALVNALAHRDYSIMTAPITFYIYNDRIEITSPGRLVYPLKVSDLENNDPIHRNEILCNIFSKTRYMEHVGTGIRKMKEAMLKQGLNEPDFIESGEFFKVVFWANENNLNTRQKEFLKSNISSITIPKYMKIFDISRNTATNDLNKLVDNKLFEKNKKGKTIIYEKL